MRDDDRERADAFFFRTRLWMDTPPCIELFGQESVGRTNEFCV